MRSSSRSLLTWRGDALSLAAACLIGCGPEIASSATMATSEQSSGSGDSDMSEEDRMAWLVISIILGVTSVGFTIAGIADGGMWSYLQGHQQDVRVALASGDGPFPSDLTHGLGLPGHEVSRVAGLLRAGRHALEPYLHATPLDEEDARAFCGELLRLLESDPVTAPRVEALEARALALARR